VSPRVILAFSPNKNAQFTAQVARGFRLGGINDPLNVTLCRGNDINTYGGHPTWDDEKVTNYEIGAKTRFADGRVTLDGALFMSKVDGLQVVADAGSCSSRIILNADAESKGAEVELFVRPDQHWDLGLSATYADAEITKSQIDPTTGNPIGGIREGNRLPTSPQLQAAATAAFNWSLTSSLASYVRLTAQHVGSSFTQLADQEPNFGVIRVPPVTRIDFDPELPSYDIVNLRWGVSTDTWEGGVFVNNVFDERAFLSVDRERGRSARVGYLTNMPRTYGVNFRMNF
jgi:iron complex outermembrane receptor protein